MTFFKPVLMMIGTMSWALMGSLAAQSNADPAAPSTRPAPDPNQKICEDVTEIGSRIAKKRVCATRAEWALRRKADREVVDDIQRAQTRPCVAAQHGTGSAPAC